MFKKLISKLNWFYYTKIKGYFFCYICGDWALKKNVHHYAIDDDFGTCIHCEEYVDSLIEEEEHIVYLKGTGRMVKNGRET